jgi:hypothetical protein
MFAVESFHVVVLVFSAFNVELLLESSVRVV